MLTGCGTGELHRVVSRSGRGTGWDAVRSAAFKPLLTEARLEDLPRLAVTKQREQPLGRAIIDPRDSPT